MKSIFTILTFFTVTNALAVSYECSSPDGQKLKIFQEKPDHAVAVLQTGLENQILKGHFVYEDETLYDVTKYDLVTSDGLAAPITLTKHVILGRGGCGRGGCDQIPGFESKKASLMINSQTKIFNCL